MLFNSTVFLFAFLPITYLVFWSLKSRNGRYAWLAATGYIFYGYWRPSFCLLMLFSTLTSYLAGLGFLSFTSSKARKWLLTVPVAVDLLLLAYFKYGDFAIESANALLSPRAGPWPLIHVVLPVGISFYTFHTISYIVDAYRGAIRPTRNFLEFATYVSLFSQLVAGPIVRFSELQGDLEAVESKQRTADVHRGWALFAVGLVEKVCLADPIAAWIDPGFASVHALATSAAWTCVIGYAYQLLLDFAGYSNMAIGLGLLFGMRIPPNFDRPYQAMNPAEFWHRWHMSLSRFLRDYLYLPLGGSRKGESRTRRNLFVTMVLGGLWHGANWTFVAWGAFHGLLLIVYRLTKPRWDRAPALGQRLVTFLLVILGWVLFRSASFQGAATLLGRMVVWVPGRGIATPTLLFLLVLAGAVTHLGPTGEQFVTRMTGWKAIVLAAAFLVAVLRVLGVSNSPFLYFQF